jgi:hypothetical protein
MSEILTPEKHTVFIISIWAFKLDNSSFKMHINHHLTVYRNFCSPSLSARYEIIKAIKNRIIILSDRLNMSLNDRIKALYQVAYEIGFLEKENLMSFEDVVRVNNKRFLSR